MNETFSRVAQCEAGKIDGVIWIERHENLIGRRQIQTDDETYTQTDRQTDTQTHGHTDSDTAYSTLEILTTRETIWTVVIFS